MRKLIPICIILAMLLGCATTQDRAQFYEAQQAFYASQAKTPIFEMKATEGKAIENLASLTVYMPMQKEQFKQFNEDNPGYRLAETVVRTAGLIGGIWIVSDAVRSIFGNFSSIANTPHNVTNTTNTYSASGNASIRYQPVQSSISGTGNQSFIGDYFLSETPMIVPPVVVAP